MRSQEEIMDLIMNTAKGDSRIRGVYLSGSRVDPDATHDKYSDFDIVYIVTDIKSFTEDDKWLDVFGERLIMQKPNDWYNHPYDYNSNESFGYLMQFKDGNRIDLTLIDIDDKKKYIDDKEPRIVLLDKDKIEGLNTIEVNNYYYIKKPSPKEFIDCCNEFWWLSVNVAKGLLREEFMYVKYFMEHYEMEMFLKMVNWTIGIENNFSVSTGKCYKYLKRYLNKEDMERVMDIFPGGNYEDIWDKFFKMCDFFNELALKVSRHFKFQYSGEEAQNIINYVKTMKAASET